MLLRAREGMLGCAIFVECSACRIGLSAVPETSLVDHINVSFLLQMMAGVSDESDAMATKMAADNHFLELEVRLLHTLRPPPHGSSRITGVPPFRLALMYHKLQPRVEPLMSTGRRRFQLSVLFSCPPPNSCCRLATAALQHLPAPCLPRRPLLTWSPT